MSDHTHIEWTDATWNPITGCSVVSAGCKHCYAMKLAGTRLRHHPSRAGLTVETNAGPVWNGQVRFNGQWLNQPIRWQMPRRIFVCAHGDLFHESVPDDWIDQIFGSNENWPLPNMAPIAAETFPWSVRTAPTNSTSIWNTEMTERPDQRYPLKWPDGWKRTAAWQRAPSPFKNNSTDKAFRELMDELGRLGARRIIISSNLKLRNDGAPYSQQPRNDDEGIAVYFSRKGKDMVLACDKFAKREDNMRAITKTIDAIRGIERWGSSDMMERAFTGFAQLAAPAPELRWWEVLDIRRDTADESTVTTAYRRKRSEHHPDNGGSVEAFNQVEKAYAEGLAEVNASFGA